MGDGTIRDIRTRLRWLRCLLGPDAPAGRFWSTQPHPANPRYAWCVEVAGRACYLGRNARLHVWLVRSGR